MPTTLFGTSGIRGDAETLFTNQFAFDLGRTFAIFLSNHKKVGAVAVGRDPRVSSPRISKAVESGLIHEGRDVYDEGVCPVPSVNYILLADDKYSGSIMISGSHIKSHLNGVKFFYDKEEISKKNEAEIEEIYQNLKEKVIYSEELGALKQETKALEEYKKMLAAHAEKYPKWKAVIDPGNGAQSEVMSPVLTSLGLNVVPLNTSIRGEFYARDTEIESDFEELKKKVLEEKADFGAGYDSDGDRVVFIDESGNFIPGDYTCALIARESQGDKVVTPINTSQVVDHIEKDVIRTKVGSPFVVEAMKSSGASFGFEGNGGGVFSEMHSRDGGRMTIEILNIMARKNISVESLISTLPRFYIFKEKVSYKWELKEKILSEAEKEFNGIKKDETDGLKIWVDETTWILFRSSMNAPEFRVFSESKDKEKAGKLLERGMNFVKKWI